MLNKFLFIGCFIIGCLLMTSEAMAQPGPPPDPDVPITGLELLLGGGALLGIRNLLNRNSKKDK